MKWSYTLHGEALTEGVHWLTVTAADNAGNIETEEFTFDVRHGSPVPVGPGAVDPTSGQFSLTATDVLSGAWDRGIMLISIARSDGRRRRTVWTTVGDQHRRRRAAYGVLSNGSVVLAASNGGETTFLE